MVFQRHHGESSDQIPAQLANETLRQLVHAQLAQVRAQPAGRGHGHQRQRGDLDAPAATSRGQVEPVKAHVLGFQIIQQRPGDDRHLHRHEHEHDGPKQRQPERKFVTDQASDGKPPWRRGRRCSRLTHPAGNYGLARSIPRPCRPMTAPGRPSHSGSIHASPEVTM